MEKKDEKPKDDKEKDAEKLYDTLKARYNLPALNDLDREFLIGTLDYSPFLLRNILMKMDERCEFAIKLLGDLVQPESHIADMHEAEFLTEDEKKLAFDLFKKFAFFHKELLMREFDYSEELSAEFIARFWKEWKQLKADLVKILKRTKEAWGSDLPADKEFGYFG